MDQVREDLKCDFLPRLEHTRRQFKKVLLDTQSPTQKAALLAIASTQNPNDCHFSSFWCDLPRCHTRYQKRWSSATGSHSPAHWRLKCAEGCEVHGRSRRRFWRALWTWTKGQKGGKSFGYSIRLESENEIQQKFRSQIIPKSEISLKE